MTTTPERRPLGLASRYPATVLVVDDEDASRAALARAMERFGHRVELAADGPEAVAKLRLRPELVLLDADMPGMDGFDVARAVRRDEEAYDVPIVMVTGLDGVQDRIRAFEAGVNDFIEKPFDVVELHLRTEAQLRLKRAFDQLAGERASLQRAVEERVADLRKALEELGEAHRRTYRAHLETVRALVLAAEFKDGETAAHVDRIGVYAEVVARALGLAPREVEVLRHACPMHDIGKIGIPDHILLKPGPLTDEERTVIERHPEIGARILQECQAEVLRVGRVIALQHHERWDGSGYPQGLREDEIALEARICAVVDVFDALTSDRRYRAALPYDEVCRMMRGLRGIHFDPDVLDAFFDVRAEIEAVGRDIRPVPVPDHLSLVGPGGDGDGRA